MSLSPSIVLVAVLAHAPAVEWHAPPECPDAAAFAKRMGTLLAGRDDIEAQAVVIITTDPDGGFAAQVRCVTGGTATERQVHGPVCESVADAAALVLAVQIDALAVGAATRIADVRRGEAPVVSAPLRLPVAVTPGTPRLAAPPPARRSSRVRAAVRIGGGAAVRQVPAIAPAIEIGAALHIGRARVQLDATWVLDRAVRLAAPNADAGADVTLIAAAARAGFAPAVRTVEFPILGGLELGDMTARGVGVAGSRLRHGAWVAALVGAGVAWVPVPAFAVRFDPALAIGLARPRFGVDVPGGVRELYRPPVVGLRLALSLEVRLGGRRSGGTIP